MNLDVIGINFRKRTKRTLSHACEDGSFTGRLLGNVTRREDREKGGIWRPKWRDGAAGAVSSVFGRLFFLLTSQHADDLTNQVKR